MARIIASQVVFRGRVFSVRRDRVCEPGGIEVTREVVTHSGSVVLLPVFPNGDILLIRQYRHAVGEFLWELVAGRIEPGEPPLAAARRELLEETGYTARRFRKLFFAYPTPGFVSEKMIFYVAEGLLPGAAQPDADERIHSKRFSPRAIKGMLRRGMLRDGKSIAGILRYWAFPAGRYTAGLTSPFAGV